MTHLIQRLLFALFATYLFSSLSVNASHGPFPPSPEAQVFSAHIEIYAPDGSLIELNSETNNIVSVVLGSDIAYSGVFGNGFLTHFRIFGALGGSSSHEFDFFDGNTNNGITVPFSLSPNENQMAFQYTWYVANNERQIVIGLLDIVNSGGIWTISSVDTNPNDNTPGTPLLAGPLAGNSVRFEMVVSTPLPGGLWLLLSGLIPALVLLRK